jgi:aminoglycoside phosphotransferase (APT) family kinase protein
MEPLAPDSSMGVAEKAAGYGLPLRVTVRDSKDSERTVVFRTAHSDEFGHNRRSDRAQGMFLAYDTFGEMPNHIRALDVGAICSDGHLQSLRGAGEFYLVTTYATGRLYAEDLRRVAKDKVSSVLDMRRCEELASYLVRLHSSPLAAAPSTYRRSIRDLVGHGEGIFGMVDSYPPDVPAASAERLASIERHCLEWRWRLRHRDGRLRRIHGDFHPFNVVFDEGMNFTLLDASRGCQGDPADDVSCMAINYVFFALNSSSSWAKGFAPLWRRFWATYQRVSKDTELQDVLAPFLAWRGLVLANPRFYPALAADARDLLLKFVERALASSRFEPDWAEALFS